MEINEENYGFDYFKRKSTIHEQLNGAEAVFSLEVTGEYKMLPQIKVRIQLPIYRINNGRTRTLQKEYIAEKGLPEDFFSKDEGCEEVQQAQHEILEKIIDEEDLLKEFKGGKHQTEPLIITHTGVVVNGNRRLCAWRDLYYNNSQKYDHFSFVTAVVLPPECDEEEIRKLEKKLQIEKSLKAEYKWHSKAMMMREEQKAGVPLSTIAKTYGDLSIKEVKLQLEALELAEDYLISIGQKDIWSRVNTQEFAFREYANQRKRITDQGQKEFFQVICYSLFREQIQSQRLYQRVKEIAQYLETIRNEFSKDRCPNSAIKRPDESDDLSLLDSDNNYEQNSYSFLAQSIHENPIENIGERLQEIILEQQAIDNEIKDSKYLINALSKISQSLTNINLTFKHPNNYSLVGVQNHIDTIKSLVSRLENEVKTKTQL